MLYGEMCNEPLSFSGLFDLFTCSSDSLDNGLLNKYLRNSFKLSCTFRTKFRFDPIVSANLEIIAGNGLPVQKNLVWPSHQKTPILSVLDRYKFFVEAIPDTKVK